MNLGYGYQKQFGKKIIECKQKNGATGIVPKAERNKNMNHNVTNLRMSVKEWIVIQDNPAQRNTEVHARKAMIKHMAKFSPAHIRVSAAKFNGALYKVDGHTRAYLWERDLLEKPEFVNVDVYPAKSIEQVIELYNHFDNKSAAENSFDKVWSAYKLNQFYPESSLLKAGKIKTCLSYLHMCRGSKEAFDEKKEISVWLKEIKLLDNQLYSSNSIGFLFLTAALLTIRRHKDSALEFWDNYVEDRGNKIDGEKDPVQMLKEYFLKSKSIGKVGHKNAVKIIGVCLACFEGFMSGNSYKRNIPQALDMKMYYNGHNVRLVI